MRLFGKRHFTPEAMAAQRIAHSLDVNPHRWARTGACDYMVFHLRRDDGLYARRINYIGSRDIFAGDDAGGAEVSGRSARELEQAMMRWAKRDRMAKLAQVAEHALHPRTEIGDV